MPRTRGSSNNRSTAVRRPRDPLGRGVIVLTESHHHLSVPRSGLHHVGIKSLDGSPPRMRHKQKNSFHAESRARSNSFDREISTETHDKSSTRQLAEKDDTINEFARFLRREDRRRRENSLDGRLPEWSDVNTHSRSKAADLSFGFVSENIRRPDGSLCC